MFTISKNFPIRHSMILYLRGHQKYDRKKLKVLLSISEFRSLNFDIIGFFEAPLGTGSDSTSFGKLLDMVKEISQYQEDKVVASLSKSIGMS